MRRHQVYLRGDSPLINLANRLRELRSLKRLTQDTIARRAKVSRATINQLENGEGDPRFSTLLSVAKAFGVTIEQLLSRAGR